MASVNEFGQAVGPDLEDWVPPPRPPAEPLVGTDVVVAPLDVRRHTHPLFAAFAEDDGSMWTYMSWGPFATPIELRDHLYGLLEAPDWQPYTLLVDGEPLGYLTYLRIAPAAGTIEVGGISLAPRIRRTKASTEAQYLLMRNAMALGYRRYEWKCDALNTASRTAAERLGFTYEGTHRQATFYKGRNRDTAWYSVIDAEWPALERAFERWLSPGNFDDRGVQRSPLATLRHGG